MIGSWNSFLICISYANYGRLGVLMSRKNERAFLIRRPNGTMATVRATTIRGAIRVFMDEYDPDVGDYRVKERNVGGWADFKVTE